MKTITYDDYDKPLCCRQCHKPLKDIPREGGYRVLGLCCFPPDAPDWTKYNKRIGWCSEDRMKVVAEATYNELSPETELKFINKYAEPHNEN
jgi:hypothetical protein